MTPTPPAPASRRPPVATRLPAPVRTAARTLRWLVLAAVAVLGLIGFGLVSAAGLRAGVSFVGGLVLVAAAFEFGAFNIRLVGRYAPSLTLPVALLSYLTTVVALALVLVAASPEVVDGLAVAVGLFSGLVIWLGGELLASWVVREQP
ncbi:hypothetical protein [Jatrophihabitans sp.]|uniref:hypothetical protein n=1 Tax=Jatrophihabitans sp. TaxID=1932789 RepID=UPI002CBDBA80|nr:hypothetical protein [Jatrophihabitans sp.]